MRRRWVVFIIVAGGVLGTVGLLLLTGLPQVFVAERVAGALLGADVQIRGLSLLGAVRADLVHVRDNRNEAPVLDARGVLIDYALFARDGRRIPRVAADFVGVDLDARDPQSTNFDFFRKLLSRPESPDKANPLAYVPRRIEIRNVSGRARFPGMAAAVNGIVVHGRVDSLDTYRVRVEGDGLDGEWNVPSQSVSSLFEQGRIRIDAQSGPDGMRLAPLEIHLPGLVEVAGSAEARLGAERVVDVDLPACRVQGADLSQAKWSFLPFPLEFREADLSGSRARFVMNADGVFIPDAALRVSAKALGLGLEGHEWYEGDLELTGSGRDRVYTGEAVLGQGQRMSAKAQGTPSEATASVRFADWTREQVLGALPKDYRRFAEAWPALQGLSGEAEVRWTKPGYAAKGVLEPELAEGGKGKATVDGKGALAGAATTFEGDVSAAWAEGTVSARVAVQPPAVAVDARLDKVDLARWLGAAPETPVPDFLRGRATGTARLAMARDVKAEGKLSLARLGPGRNVAANVDAAVSAPSKATLRPLRLNGTAAFPEAGGKAAFDLTLPEGGAWQGRVEPAGVDLAALMALLTESTVFRDTGSKLTGRVQFDEAKEGLKGTVELTAAPSPLPQVFAPAEAPLAVKGPFGADAGFDRFAGSRLDFASGEEARFAFADWTFVVDDKSLRGTLNGEAPAAQLAPLARLNVQGRLQAQAPVTYAEGKVTAPFELTVDEAGYGNYSGPPGVPVTAKGIARYDVEAARGIVEGVEALWTDATRLTLEPVRFTTEPRVEETRYTLETDLAPVLYLGMLSDAEGRATAKGAFRYAGAFTAEADVDLAAPAVTLPSKLAVLGGAALRGTFRYAGGISGEGQFGAAEVTAAGAMLREARGPFRLREGRLSTQGMEARLWDGRLTADADAGVFVEGMPVTASARVAEVNLDTFTKEYKPPKTRLTGIGGGTVSLEWTREGFQDLDVSLASRKDFSMNRDLVYQLLLSGYVKDARGGRRLDRAINQVLGEAEMRPFDEGAMELALTGENIGGDALLSGGGLKLVININIEQDAFASLLRLRQEERLENIDKVRAEPLQLGN